MIIAQNARMPETLFKADRSEIAPSSFNLVIQGRMHFGHALKIADYSILVISTTEGIVYHKALPIDNRPDDLDGLDDPGICHVYGSVIVKMNCQGKIMEILSDE